MRRFSVIGTAHVADPRLLRALEVALDETAPDQLILEMPDEVAVGGDPEGQKPEMIHAWRWARARGVPVRGHEPAGPPILRDGLSPVRIAELVRDMDALVQGLAPRRIIDIFCRRDLPGTSDEQRLAAVIDELVDLEKAFLRSKAIVATIGRHAAPTGAILIVCGGNHAPHVAAGVSGCKILSGEHFF